MGASFADPEHHASWAEEEGFGFEIWTDDDHTLAEHYGAAEVDAVVPLRQTFVLDAQGMLLLQYTDGVTTGTHPAKVRSDLRLLLE